MGGVSQSERAVANQMGPAWGLDVGAHRADVSTTAIPHLPDHVPPADHCRTLSLQSNA